MDQRNNTIQQFNIPPSTAYDSGNRYITSTVHNDMQGIPCQQSATTMASQPTFLQASLPNQSQQMLLIPNGAQNSGNMIMNNQQPSVGYQIRPAMVTLRTETNYFGQQGPTAVHTNYITPSPQRHVNTNYASNLNPLMSMNSMIAGTVSSVNTINTPNANGIVPRTVPQNQTGNVNPLSSVKLLNKTEAINTVNGNVLLPRTVPQNQTSSVNPLSSVNLLNKTEAINTVNGNVLLPRTVPQNQTSNVNPNIKQVMAAPQLRLPATTSNKVPENLIRLQKFLKQIVADKHDISKYLIEGTVDNLNLIAILCHPKFRSEFLRLSNNERLKMQIRNRMMKESGKIISAHSGPLNTVKSKSIQNILDTLLALTWIHPNSDGPNSTKTRQHQESRYSPQTLYKNNGNNSSMTSQPITSQNQPHHSKQQVSQSQPPAKVAQSNATSNVRVKKEPGLETAKSSNCSGSGGNFSTGDQMKSLAQPAASDNMYANFEDFVRMSDEAAEPIDSMFEPIVKENSNQRDVKPVVSNLLNSAAVTPKVPSTNSIPMNTNLSEPPDIKPVINPKTLPNHHPPVISSSSSQKLQSTVPNSNNLVQLLQSAQNGTSLKPNLVKPYIYSSLPENQSKETERQMTLTAPLSSTSDNFLKSLEELQKNAFDSLEASSASSPFPQVRNQNILNTNPVPSLPPSQAKNSSSIPTSSVISSVASSPMYTSSVLTPLRDKKKDLFRPLSPNNMCRVEAEDQQHICSSLVESGLSDKKMQDLIKVKKGEVICSLSSKLKPNPEANVPPVNYERSHFWCNFCVYQTDNKLRLVNHVIAAHRFSCQFCKFQCFSRAEVFEHTVTHHQQASQMSKEFKLCVLLPDYLKTLEKVEDLDNDNFETEFIQSMRKKVRAGRSISSNGLESDWEDEFLEDETESEISDIESDDSTKQKGRKRKKPKSYLSSDNEHIQNEHEKKKSISKAFKELQRRRKMKKMTNSRPNGSGDAEIYSEPSIKSTSASPKPNVQGSTNKLKNKSDKKKKVKPTNAKVNKKRPSRMTAGKRTNDGSNCFMALEAMLSGDEKQISDQSDEDTNDADFVPDSDSEKNKKRKLSDFSPVQLTKTPRVVLTKFNLLKRCIHCDYSSGEIQAIKLHSLDEHTGLFLGVWQDSLDIVLYICPNRFCDFYGSSFNDYLNHLEKCNFDSTDDILESVAQTKKYIKCLKDKRIVKPTKLDSMREMIVKCLDTDETLNTSTASTAVVENNLAAKAIGTTITTIPSNSSVVDKDTTSTSTNNSKPTTNNTVSKDISKPIKVSKDINSEETVFKCAFCSFKSLARPLGVRNHTVKCHPELPLYAINLKCVEEGRDNRFVLFCVGVDCTAEFLESSDYFKHIETCDAVKKLSDDTQLLKTNKFVKSTIHRL